MRKIILIALALIAAALVAVALQVRNSDRVTDLQSQPLLDEAKLSQLAAVEQIELARAGQQVVLQRDGEAWTVANRDQFPLQRERLAALLLALREARVIEAKTSNPDYHARLGLTEGEGNDSALGVSVKAAEGGFGLLFGNKVGSDQLVRFANEDQVWLVNRALSMSANPQDWLDLQVSQIPLEQVATAHWRYADGEELRLDKASEGDYNFKLADGEGAGQERKLNSMVLALADLRAQNVSPRTALELGEPVLVMQLGSWSGATLDASLYEVGGAYWLTIDQLDQSEENPLTVNADARWAFQLGVAQHDRMVLRHADLKTADDAAGQPEQN
ncbi:DUF4340 domain-containing protein [Halopseudomonas aestusnigri]|jgi:uncharacterized protein DUF4340|uniref:DUF4340 domain-containing protein n=1 Tax=Halopseudomonas TaxID=2901189 RepID=UPI000C463CED|nr:DUF4340 domain-containing protein [Halopseudomonas aestusnigri]MAD27081.1 hypothetical protein [Pseudomonadales bacterium]MEE2800315.1 DUF4340 domain-containing protein [Pseudomonadota bacterium]HBT56365.1 hypothetical protein [Pseudomonas sp.]MAH00934.1 hypothetical protein [Pseudomonadales bacterium]MAK73620.1 hypothetical protein [Pseudomonadales bacterium]|tara:strand:- start:2841 stop:3833 length:993 start_codon:yes stop_codon:yes gene_type:complete